MRREESEDGRKGGWMNENEKRIKRKEERGGKQKEEEGERGGRKKEEEGIKRRKKERGGKKNRSCM